MLPDGLLSGEAAPLRCVAGVAGAGRGRMRAAASSSQKWNIMIELAIWVAKIGEWATSAVMQAARHACAPMPVMGVHSTAAVGAHQRRLRQAPQPLLQLEAPLLDQLRPAKGEGVPASMSDGQDSHHTQKLPVRQRWENHDDKAPGPQLATMGSFVLPTMM